MADRPELLDYIVFFEVEPEWVHPGGLVLRRLLQDATRRRPDHRDDRAG
jgi:hypothetical protein